MYIVCSDTNRLLYKYYIKCIEYRTIKTNLLSGPGKW